MTKKSKKITPKGYLPYPPAWLVKLSPITLLTAAWFMVCETAEDRAFQQLIANRLYYLNDLIAPAISPVTIKRDRFAVYHDILTTFFDSHGVNKPTTEDSFVKALPLHDRYRPGRSRKIRREDGTMRKTDGCINCGDVREIATYGFCFTSTAAENVKVTVQRALTVTIRESAANIRNLYADSRM